MDVAWGGRVCLAWLCRNLHSCMECEVFLFVLSFVTYSAFLMVRVTLRELLLTGFQRIRIALRFVEQFGKTIL